ncbi:MAG: FAD-binding oxidoreductase [Gammaproteobacteria bacterium]|nr:FAD-binding oxidoreductase [Gammaproteobacteria bacterium]
MSAPLLQIESSSEAPASADIVIIGGGIIGAFTAYYLAQRGFSVALLEKGRIGAEQSSRNWGWCRQQNRDARELPLATKSLELWERFAAETGEETGFRRCGLLYLSNDDEELATWARWRDFARTVGVTTHVLSGAEATERGGMTGRQWRGGVFAPTDGIADPASAAPAVARAVMKLGGCVLQRCAVRGIETAAGRVAGVITERGVIRTRIVVLSAGAWASSFLHQHGIRFPQATIRQTVMALATGPEPIPDALYTANVACTRRGDGGHTIAISGRGRIDPTPQLLRFATDFLPMFVRRWRKLSPGGFEGVRAGHERWSRWSLDRPTPMELVRILDPAPDLATARLTRERAETLLPAFKGRAVTAIWAGFVDTTPDGVPGIGELSQLPGLVLAAGFSGHGFGIGPGSGHLVADLVSGGQPLVDPEPLHPRRLEKSSWGAVSDF